MGKKILKILLVLFLIGLSISILLIGYGYNMYKEAIEEVPLEEKSSRNTIQRELYIFGGNAANVY